MSEVNEQSLNAWRKALSSMRPGNKVYKPAILLVAIDLIDEGKATPSAVRYSDVSERFRKLVSKVRPGSPNASEPFVRLGGDGIWRVPAAEGKQNREAEFAQPLAGALESAEGRTAIRNAVYQQLADYGKDECTRLAEAHRS